MTVAVTEPFFSRPLAAQDCAITANQLVAVDHLAALIDHDQPVRIAVERNADMGAAVAHDRLQLIGMHRTAIAVDIGAVRLDADRNDIGAQLPEHGRRHLVGSAVGAVDHHLQALEAHALGEARLHELDVATRRVVDALGAAELGRSGQALRKIVVGEAGLDFRLNLVVELEAVGTEQLDAVVLIRIVRGGDHDAEIGAHRARQHADRRRRHRPSSITSHAHRKEAGAECRLQHVAESRVSLPMMTRWR